MCRHVPACIYHVYENVYIYAYAHTNMTTYIHACLHTYRQTYIHTCMHAYTQTDIHTCMRTYIPTYIHTYIHSYMHTYIYAYAYAYAYANAHTYANEYVRAYMYMYMYMYMYICIYISRPMPSNRSRPTMYRLHTYATPTLNLPHIRSTLNLQSGRKLGAHTVDAAILLNLMVQYSENIAIVSYTSKIPQHDIGNCLSPCSTRNLCTQDSQVLLRGACPQRHLWPWAPSSAPRAQTLGCGAPTSWAHPELETEPQRTQQCILYIYICTHVYRAWVLMRVCFLCVCFYECT